MISKADIIKVTLRIRKTLGYSYSSTPSILKVEIDEEQRRLYILCGDRPDRFILLGPSGIVLYQLARELNFEAIIVKTLTDIKVKNERVRQAIIKEKDT